MIINKIIELDDVFTYLKTRGLLKQYKKAKKTLLSWDTKTVLFKKRKPKTSKIYQFRINKKYRAFWYFDIYGKDIFRVIEISDHQDY